MRRAIDEMKLTAYALGELEDPDRQMLESELADSEEDRLFVQQTHDVAQIVRDELARENCNGLDAIHYAAIELRLRQSSAQPIRDRRAVIRGRIGLALSLAASIVIVAGVIFSILYSLQHPNSVATGTPTSQPNKTPVIVTFPESPTEQPSPSVLIAQVPGTADPFVQVSQQPLCAFPLTADTESYDQVRRALADDRLPDPQSVRIEGLVNAFEYDLPSPVGAALFGAKIEVGQCPWQTSHRLARVALRARDGAGTVAQDVRAEVAFNSNAVKSYRLIGYENRSGARGSTEARVEGGHSITALYELTPQANVSASQPLTLKLRYRGTHDPREQMLEFAAADVGQSPSADFDFVAAVAEFGMLLSHSSASPDASFQSVLRLAEAGRGADTHNQRLQFIHLVQRARDLLG